MLINMTKKCKENGITSFSRTRGGWMKIVEGWDSSQRGGFCFVGSNFVKVGNYETELKNGIYLDCSKHYDKSTDTKTEIMNLFAIKNGDVTLLNTIPKATRGWAYEFEEDVKTYFAESEVTATYVLNEVRNMTCERDILHEVGRNLLKDERKTVWLNKKHFDAYMEDACVFNADFHIHLESVQEMAVSLFRNTHDAKVYFNYEIDNEYHLRMVYSFIHCVMKEYVDFEIVYEDIEEDYYLKMSNLQKLRNINTNDTLKGRTHDVGYWFMLDDDMYATESVIYIVVPNCAKEQILVQKMKFTHRFNQK